ncbi:ubiquinone biosynthesis protein [Thioclava sp. SK-1]|nr:ubiquinone biosynthesis protein [Thioclava sp. SK-1]
MDVDRAKSDLLAAIEPHVPFDGWTRPAFEMAVADSDIDLALAEVICPRGAVDLAIAYHRKGDQAMCLAVKSADFDGMKFRDKVAACIRMRLEGADPELVRRGATLFALPQNTAVGAKLIWETADKVWNVLGDSSRDYNWYTKRATLSGVYSATVLFWMGDESEGHCETWEFLDRRIGNVMQFEKVKGKLLKLPFAERMVGAIRAPQAGQDMPGKTYGAADGAKERTDT